MNDKTSREGNTQNKIFTIPNILSFFRLCLIPFLIWLYCVEHNSMWTAYILLLSGATDIIDGFIARRFHMVSDLGKVLDPIADKLTQATMLFCLLTRFPLMIAPIVLMLFKELCMGISGFQVIRKVGIVPGADWHGKVATCLLYGMMLLHVVWHDIPPMISNICIVICMAMMIISLVLYGQRNWNALKHSLKNNAPQSEGTAK
ncbi:MAG: CDP-alcohol phosphatidyltransferase family protein [Eubacteriales bacterium]|nr:CDP-alcohol phosphatidyltransferase family protein [Eubacteriales bacterium]